MRKIVTREYPEIVATASMLTRIWQSGQVAQQKRFNVDEIIVTSNKGEPDTLRIFWNKGLLPLKGNKGEFSCPVDTVVSSTDLLDRMNDYAAKAFAPRKALAPA